MKKLLTMSMGILMGLVSSCSNQDFFGVNSNPSEDPSEQVTEDRVPEGEQVSEKEWMEVFENTFECLFGIKGDYTSILRALEGGEDPAGVMSDPVTFSHTLPQDSNYKIVYNLHRIASESDPSATLPGFQTTDSGTLTLVVANGKAYGYGYYRTVRGEEDVYEQYAERNIQEPEDGRNAYDSYTRRGSGEWTYRSEDDYPLAPIDTPFFAELHSWAGLVYTDAFKEKGCRDYLKELTGMDCVYTYDEDGNFYEGPSFNWEYAPHNGIKTRYKIRDGKIIYIGSDQWYLSRTECYSYSAEITYGGQSVEIPPEVRAAKNSK